MMDSCDVHSCSWGLSVSRFHSSLWIQKVHVSAKGTITGCKLRLCAPVLCTQYEGLCLLSYPTLAETAVKDRFGSSVANWVDLLWIIKFVVGVNCGQSICGNERIISLAHDVMTPTCAVKGAITSRRLRLNAAGLQRLRCFCIQICSLFIVILIIGSVAVAPSATQSCSFHRALEVGS